MCHHHAMQYDSGWDLSQLPYFDVREGRLVVTEPDLPPVIDMHTHLALAYVLPMKVDLFLRTGDVRHYLPLDSPWDLDVYANRNWSEDHLAAIKRDLTLGSLTARGMRATHTGPNLAWEMEGLNVAYSVLLPIDFPVLSDNTGAYLRVAEERRELLAFGSVHPYAPNLKKRVAAVAGSGVRGLKVHPNVQMVRPDDRRAMRLYRLAAERGLPILWHCGPVGIEPPIGRYLCQLRHYRKPVAECSETTFILGHSGALQMEEALSLALRYENVYLELSSQSATNVRRILDEGPEDRIVFGSDWPFYHQALPLAKVLMATEGRPELRRKVLWENAARLLGLPHVHPPAPAAG